MTSPSPEWATAPTLLRGPPFPAGDAVLVPEWSAVGHRVRVTAIEEEEAGSEAPRPVERLWRPEAVAAIAEALATGRDVSLSHEAWGRTYRETWSLTSPGPDFPDGTHLWFYPMDQRRRLVRIEAGPLAAALGAALAWLHAHPFPPPGPAR